MGERREEEKIAEIIIHEVTYIVISINDNRKQKAGIKNPSKCGITVRPCTLNMKGAQNPSMGQHER